LYLTTGAYNAARLLRLLPFKLAKLPTRLRRAAATAAPPRTALRSAACTLTAARLSCYDYSSSSHCSPYFAPFSSLAPYRVNGLRRAPTTPGKTGGMCRANDIDKRS